MIRTSFACSTPAPWRVGPADVADDCQYRIGVDGHGLAIYCCAPSAPGVHAYCAVHRVVCVEQGRHVSVGDVSFSMLEIHEKRAARTTANRSDET